MLSNIWKTTMFKFLGFHFRVRVCAISFLYATQKDPHIGIIEVPDTDPVEYVYGGSIDPAVNDTLQSDCAQARGARLQLLILVATWNGVLSR